MVEDGSKAVVLGRALGERSEARVEGVGHEEVSVFLVLLEREAAERGRLGVGVAAVGAGVAFNGLGGEEFIGSVPC